jgi:AhpD family alkylhydroperoxidase
MTTSRIHPYRTHSIESAPERSRHALQVLRNDFGFLPNAAAIMAESPTLLNAFVGVFEIFHAGTFTGAQRQVLLLSNAVANTCPWAVALHSALALKEGVDDDDVRAIRERRPPKDARHAALSRFTRALIDNRGRANEDDLAAFTAAGFSHDQVLEVLVGLAGSTMTNYASNLTDPVVEDQFKAQIWRPS